MFHNKTCHDQQCSIVASGDDTAKPSSLKMKLWSSMRSWRYRRPPIDLYSAPQKFTQPHGSSSDARDSTQSDHNQPRCCADFFTPLLYLLEPVVGYSGNPCFDLPAAGADLESERRQSSTYHLNYSWSRILFVFQPHCASSDKDERRAI